MQGLHDLPSLSDVADVVALNLSFNEFDRLPSLTAFASLERLNLSHNAFKALDFNIKPSVIGGRLLRSLRYLDLSGNRRVGAVQLLDALGTRKDEAGNVIQRSPPLEELWCGRCGIGWDITERAALVATLKDLSHLSVLVLADNPATKFAKCHEKDARQLEEVAAVVLVAST